MKRNTVVIECLHGDPSVAPEEVHVVVWHDDVPELSAELAAQGLPPNPPADTPIEMTADTRAILTAGMQAARNIFRGHPIIDGSYRPRVTFGDLRREVDSGSVRFGLRIACRVCGFTVRASNDELLRAAKRWAAADTRGRSLPLRGLPAMLAHIV